MFPLAFSLDLFGAGKIADAVKAGEWIVAIFAALSWALWHPSTIAYLVGAVFVLAVIRKGWPFANVPNIDSLPGKALLFVGLFLVCGGFAWRAADEVFSAHVPQAKPPTSQSTPAQRQTITVPTGQKPIEPPSG